jgi:hypothetical protein
MKQQKQGEITDTEVRNNSIPLLPFPHAKKKKIEYVRSYNHHFSMPSSWEKS